MVRRHNPNLEIKMTVSPNNLEIKMTVGPKAYAVGAGAALAFIQKEVAEILPLVPFPFRGTKLLAKQAHWARQIAKVVLDAVDAEG
jgi:hypothetical protein